MVVHAIPCSGSQWDFSRGGLMGSRRREVLPKKEDRERREEERGLEYGFVSGKAGRERERDFLGFELGFFWC